MAPVALDPAYRRIGVEEFLEMDFQGAPAELEDGLIFMVAGGNEAHSRVTANILVQLHIRLRGSGCRPYGPDFATRTAERTVRLPDVSVYCNGPSAPGNDHKKLLGDPQVVVEVLSPSTFAYDQTVTLEEYRCLSGVQEIMLVDPIKERVRLLRRDGLNWEDRWLSVEADVPLASLDIVIPQAEIFVRD